MFNQNKKIHPEGEKNEIKQITKNKSTISPIISIIIFYIVGLIGHLIGTYIISNQDNTDYKSIILHLILIVIGLIIITILIVVSSIIYNLIKCLCCHKKDMIINL